MINLNGHHRFILLCVGRRLQRHHYSTRTLSGKRVRKSFIDYFVQDHDHTFVRSSPVVPFCDPTVPFVNAGMNQFKGVFLGNTHAPCLRAANSQKCIRVGGKHNDLEVVGTDGYHHTFFEMLGSWSFGDYFKKEACELAWNLLTHQYGLSPLRLYVTYFGGDSTSGLEPDLETRDIWRQIGVSSDRILPFGSDDNFWEMGASGPCGPCTEIHVDHIPDRKFAADKVNKGHDDLTELWNLVFIQYNRGSDGSLTELPCHHVDTGMGLERLVAILQGKGSNYDTDLFQPLFNAIHKHSKGIPEYQGRFEVNDIDGTETAYRILADHARMVTVALADGMFPDQNYKLRRVMRKAMLVSEQMFGVENGLLCELTNHVAESLGDIYPEIVHNLKQVQLIIRHEEELLHSLRKESASGWQKILREKPDLEKLDILEMPGLVSGYYELNTFKKQTPKEKNTSNILPVDLTFKLYDTYGLDEHTIKKLGEVEGFSVDIDKFRNALNTAKIRSKESYRYDRESEELLQSLDKLSVKGLEVTDDSLKYNYTIQNDRYVFPSIDCEVKAILVNGKLVPEVASNIECGIVLNQTNFYHEAGGQSSDKGMLSLKNGSKFQVREVVGKKGYILHYGTVISDGSKISEGDIAKADMDEEHRLGNMRNHTATHLVNAALRKMLSVTCQKSSRVTESNLVFDFSVYGEAFNTKNVEELEERILKCVESRLPVTRRTVSSEELITGNVTLLPGEVYPAQGIHIIEVDARDILTSREACCGTHVLNTADIRDFCVVGVRTAGSGTRSLRAVTGPYALNAHSAGYRIKSEVSHVLMQVDEFLKSNQSSQQAEVLDSKLQELKQKLTDDSDAIPYLVRAHLLEQLDSACRKLKDSARVNLRDALESEMQELLKGAEQAPYLVHFLQCSSTMDSVPLQKAVRMCTHIPVLLIAHSEGVVKAKSVVPKEMVSEHFNAELWMQPVLKVLKAQGAAPKGQDPHLVYNMKGRKMSAEKLRRVVNTALEGAATFAQKQLSSSASQARSSGS